MSDLAITVLGSSGSYAAPGNPCTGYLVHSPKATVLLDCGPGTLGPLQDEVALDDLTAIVITHCHPDHWVELPVLRNVFTFFQPREDVPVYGTAETKRMDDAVHVRANGRPDVMSWTVIDPSSKFTIGDQRWSFALTDHPVETLAVRVDVGERSFAFSSDSGPGWDFRSLGPGIDLAMCDASHTSELEGQSIPHMSAREAAVAAKVANIDRLVITHLIPGSDPAVHLAEAEAAYGGSVVVARPGLRLDV